MPVLCKNCEWGELSHLCFVCRCWVLVYNKTLRHQLPRGSIELRNASLSGVNRENYDAIFTISYCLFLNNSVTDCGALTELTLHTRRPITVIHVLWNIITAQVVVVIGVLRNLDSCCKVRGLVTS